MIRVLIAPPPFTLHDHHLGEYFCSPIKEENDQVLDLRTQLLSLD